MVPGADIDVCPDAGIAKIGQVADLRAGAEYRVLDLDEVADFGLRSDIRAGPETGEGPDRRIAATCAPSRWLKL